MTGEQERRAVALQAIDRFCEKNGVEVPALEEKRVENRVEFRGTVLHNGEPATFGVAYEVDPRDWCDIGWVAALKRPARSRRFFRDLSLDELCQYLAYGNEGCVGVNSGRANREFRKREAKACAA